ncbi:hypothetical protein N7520_002508 [Penicillium odoratum]|uniref:uncharacterized protein n=1 Tax=Penicillium odoratum TaxID=1167516 RepID=UPI002549622A|nr:uncharacterized protein N7520_002508 [Penicillium odoratum]KAJ5771979.1 hypothetical protein N7520_002508 [Penicillium odoratum]
MSQQKAPTQHSKVIDHGNGWKKPQGSERGTFGGSTHDNQILTWGVNDEGALGRDTGQDKDEDAGDGRGKSLSGDESDEDEVTYNLKEATPLPVDPSHFPRDTVFSQLAASDSATFALLTMAGSMAGELSEYVCRWSGSELLNFTN